MPPPPLRHRIRSCVGLATLCVSALAASRTHAAPSEKAIREARDLFAEVERDEDAGRWEAALEKLRRIADVRLTAGVRYHMALCDEHAGRLATAMTEYQWAHDAAVAEKARDVLALVGPAFDAVLPRVPRLVLRAAPRSTAPAGDSRAVEVLTLDDMPVAPAPEGNAFPLNPGPHRIEWSVAGQRASSAVVTLNEADVAFFAVPATVETPSIPALPPARERPPAPHAQVSRAPAWIAAGGAAALGLVGVGAYFAAGVLHNQGVTDCARAMSVAPDGCDSQKGAVRTWNWVAAGAWAGAAIGATAAVILWSAPANHLPDARAKLVVGPGSANLLGTF